ncbi:MAG TPA: DUF3499 family protein [Acidimicrobiales bacterium]
MTRTGLCARPGCAVVAGAWLTYDYAGQQVWLDDMSTTGDGNRWALCASHAERLRVPQGWVVQDRRIGPRPEAPGHRDGLRHPDRNEGDGARLSSLAG